MDSRSPLRGRLCGSRGRALGRIRVHSLCGPVQWPWTQSQGEESTTTRCSPKLLGVLFDIQDKHDLLKPCPDRVTRLSNLIQKIIHNNVLPVDEAQKLCGKFNFLQTTCFGQVGRALLLLLYGRAHSQDINGPQLLNGPLVASLKTLLFALPKMQPRKLPITTDHPCTSIYTHAFFQLETNRSSLPERQSRGCGDLQPPSEQCMGLVVRAELHWDAE